MLKRMKKADGRSLSPQAQEERRRQALRLREEMRLTWREIARMVGVHIGTVLDWAQRFGRGGEAGLKARRRGRRYLTGRTLSLSQEWQVRSILVDETPGQRGLGFALWNRRAVMELIGHLFGVAMPIRTVGSICCAGATARNGRSSGPWRNGPPRCDAGPTRPIRPF